MSFQKKKIFVFSSGLFLTNKPEGCFCGYLCLVLCMEMVFFLLHCVECLLQGQLTL